MTSTPLILRSPCDGATPTVAPSPAELARPELHLVTSPADADRRVEQAPDAAPAHVELLLRIHLVDDDRRGWTFDVVVDLDTSHTTADLVAALAQHFRAGAIPYALGSIRTGRVLRADATMAEIDLVSGDELVLGSPPTLAPRRAECPRRALTVDVVAGPDSGRSQLLHPGRFVIGRRSDCDVSIDDPSVSRRHAVIEAAEQGGSDRALDWTITVHPMPDAPNGVTVNDRHIDGPTVVTTDDVLGLGGTRLALRAVERGRDEHVDRLGQIEFHRTPYQPPAVVERATEPVGPIPDRPEPRRLQIFAVLAPLAAGVLMYTFTHQVQFLALTLISPIVMVSSVVEDRRTGRRRFRRELCAFRDGLVEQRRRLERLRHRERCDRLRSAPDLAELTRRAELRTIDLWARGRGVPDFLRLRLGLGTASVMFPIELDRGGADDLRAEALAAVDGLDTVDNVPITVDLVVDPVLGVHGEPDLVDGVAASLLVQAATLHSPDDLVVAAAIAPERPLGWLKWLPHVRSVTSPLPGNHVAATAADTGTLVAHLTEIASYRTDDEIGAHRGDGDRCWPRILAVVDAELHPDPAAISRLLDLAPAAGISVVWLSSAASGVPRQAGRILDIRRGVGAAMVGRLWSTDPGVDEHELEVEHLRPHLADRVARALAPVRDASSASLTTSIPRVAPLLDVLGVGKPTAAWVRETWQRSTGYDLRFPIGIDVDGPLELDLVADGPHTLIGGTSGAGKSELLQSMVVALAARYPSTRLNFLFVDYKGGASTQVFERLPHTVGAVTNLSADLSLRALTSLRAELNHRMAIMEGRAKDLAEMIERFPDDAPASLVIIVDEFATLVKEVPDFVAGVIDIAQRGRSLGIHLVLATQRPSGSVNENILANTNLRISLRMLDRTESTSVIGSPDAADIPVPLKGRALARLGPRRLVEFQSAFAGAPVVSGDERQPVLVADYRRTDDTPRHNGSRREDGRADGPGDGDTTHLAALVDAIVDAADELDLPEPRRPWREVLPEIVLLDDVLGERSVGERIDPGRFVTVGLLDAPEQQEQRPAVIDLEDGGGWLVFGSGGSGKTTLLRTVAASLSADAERADAAGDVAMLVLDFASRGLSGLQVVPEVIDVATGDDLEAVTRHLAVLDAELERRRRLLADAGAEHVTAYRRDGGVRLPRIVVMIDGFGGLASTLLETAGSFAMSSGEHWNELVLRLVVDGRQVGIHTIITADRRNAVPSRLHAAVANRLILRHADEGSYAEHGIAPDRARDLHLPAGRGLLDGSTAVQVASVSTDAAARAQATAIADRVARSCRPPTPTLVSAALPERVATRDLPAPTEAGAERGLLATIGVADVTGMPVTVELDWSNLTVCGPPRSGRSTALVTVADSLAAHHRVVAVGPARSPLGQLQLDRSAFGGAAELAPVLDRLANEAASGAGGERPVVLVVDDIDTLDDPILNPLWERLAGLDGLRLAVSLEGRAMTGYTMNAVVSAARRARRVLVLRPDDPSEFLQATGVKLPTRPGLRMPVGRGVLLTDRQPTIVQVATP